MWISQTEKQQSGHTLLELLIYLLISSVIVIGISWGDFDFQSRNRVQYVLNDLTNAINTARNTALIENKKLSMLPLEKHWDKGYILCMPAQKHQAPTILYRHEWTQKNIHISWHGFLSRKSLDFAPDIMQMASNGYFLIAQGNKKKKLNVNRLGLVREVPVN